MSNGYVPICGGEGDERLRVDWVWPLHMWPSQAAAAVRRGHCPRSGLCGLAGAGRVCCSHPISLVIPAHRAEGVNLERRSVLEKWSQRSKEPFVLSQNTNNGISAHREPTLVWSTCQQGLLVMSTHRLRCTSSKETSTVKVCISQR